MIGFFKSALAFAEFYVQWKLKGGSIVDDNTANIRASICVGCHNNKPTSEVRKKTCCGGGAAQSAALVVARATIVKGKTTPYDKQLLACMVCGCDNRISVWIPNDVLVATVDANAYPTFCWKKKILEGANI